MERDRGVALILALLVLSFLTILGGALLTTSTIDIWISDNYKTVTQSLYLAEAGIESRARICMRHRSRSFADRSGPDQAFDGAGPPLLTVTISRSFRIRRSARSTAIGRARLAATMTSGCAMTMPMEWRRRTDTNEVVTLISSARVRQFEEDH